jgi:hypothetical protein
MRNRIALSLCPVLVALVAIAAPGSARAQGSEGTGIGVGVQAMQGHGQVFVGPGFGPIGLVGPSVVYQTPDYHIDGILAFSSNGARTFGVGGRFFYELHSTQASDLSIGGGIGILNVDPPLGDSSTSIHFEIGGKIRAFLAPAVAVSASVGFGFVSDPDGDDPLFLTGQLLGTVGVTYFFF